MTNGFDHKRILLFDIGNTRIKWRVYCGASELDQGSFSWQSVDTFSALPSFESIDCVGYASVGSVVIEQALMAFCLECWSIEPIKAVVDTAMLPTDYTDIESLGVDRWLALLAFGSKINVLVVDAGSAVTLDWLESGRHLGGYIAPGIQLMANSLNSFTARLPLIDRSELSGCTDLLPSVTTGDCMARGVWSALVGSVLSAIEVRPVEKVIVTGGDGAKLTELLAKSLAVSHSSVTVDYSNDLVFSGLLAFVEIKIS